MAQTYEDREEKAASFLEERGEQGATIAEVAKKLDISPREARSLLESLAEEGIIRRVVGEYHRRAGFVAFVIPQYL